MDWIVYASRKAHNHLNLHLVYWCIFSAFWMVYTSS
jgi:hypothetical protein